MKNISCIIKDFVVLAFAKAYLPTDPNLPSIKNPITISAVCTAVDIKIDGNLDDAVWENAEVFTYFS
jgi:hypothetical protein